MVDKVEGSITINCQVKEAWDYITCVNKIPEWMIGVTRVLGISDTPIKVGTTFRAAYPLGWTQTKSSHEVIELEPLRRLRMKVHYKTLGRTTWSFEPEGSGTKVSATAQHNFGEFKKKILAKELKNIKLALETGKIPGGLLLKGMIDDGLVKDVILKERIGGSIHVDRPVQEIWDYMMQVDRIPEWAAGASGVVDISDIPLRVGSTFSTVYALDGEEIVGPHKVIELTPPNVWGLQIHYTIVAFTTWKLIPEGNGTKVTVSVEYNFTESGNKAIEKEVRFLKQVLETGKIPEESLRGKEQW